MTLHRVFFRSALLTVMAVTVVLGFATCSDDDSPTCPTPDTRDLVTYLFAAQVTQVTDSQNLLGGAIAGNDIMIGTLTWDRSVPDTCSFNEVGCYRSVAASCGISIKHNGLVFATDPRNVRLDIIVADNYNEYFIYEDFIIFKSYNNVPVISQGELFEFILELRGDTTPLDATDLPSTLPALDMWRSAVVYMARSNPGGSFTIAGTIVEMQKQ